MSAPIPFADNLAESLPDNYTFNHALLPKLQQEAIAEDFRRWRLAKEWFEPRRLAATTEAKQRTDNNLRNYVTTLEPQAYRDDMRRRLNTLLHKLNHGVKN